MASNINKLNKDFEEILLGLTPEEAVEYYKQLNKKLIKCLPNLNSANFKHEELTSVLANIENITSVFKKEYPLINQTNISLRYLELFNKYLIEVNKAQYKIELEKIKNVVYKIGSKLQYIKYFLDSIYNYYTYRTYVKEGLIENELDVPEDISSVLEPYFNNSSSYYGATAESYINDFIKLQFENLEKIIDLFNNYFYELDLVPDNPVLFSDKLTKAEIEEFKKEFELIIVEYNEVYNSGLQYIKEFEELKVNPFKEAVEISVKTLIEFSSVFNEEDYSRLIENELASAPSYNFETFEIILPNTETIKGVGNND